MFYTVNVCWKVKKYLLNAHYVHVVQWIRCCTPNAGGLGSNPGQGARSHMHATTKSSHATTKEPASHN